ncbi:Crp/Fnr family transcriptional regulator [Sorangium sp. So ce726]|uniref:Crp/Fnr family transcriptional regulator n=1 Tax=Sorangium sp. So ce726 TaxID=3133319 RepID=UPI003F611EFC
MNPAKLFPFIAALSDRGRAELGALPATHVAAHEQLLRRGDTAAGAYLILQGALRVYYVTDDGREATLYRVEAGETCVLAMSSALRAHPYPAWVQAAGVGATFTRVLNPAFQRLMDAEPAFRDFVLSSMTERIFELMATLERLATSTMIQRVSAYLVRHADAAGEVAATQIGIASELGTAREVIFRALRTLAARGLITTARGRVRIVDARALADVARA